VEIRGLKSDLMARFTFDFYYMVCCKKILYVLANSGPDVKLKAPMKCNITLNFDSEPAKV
jgi:hypothetical protein